MTRLCSVASHDASTKLPLTEFFIGCIFSNNPLDRQTLPSAHCSAGNASPPQPPDIATLCTPAAPAMLATVTRTLRPRACHHSRHRVSRGMPTCAPLMAYLLKRHRCDLVCVHLSQSRPHSHMSIPPKWEHILCAQLLPTGEVQVPPLREPTILLVQILEQELVLFLNHEPWFFPWSNLGNPNLTGLVTLMQATVISCIINTVCLSFSGIQGRRARTPPILLRRPEGGSMRLFFKNPVIMFRTSPISFLRILVTRTSQSCSTRTPLSPDPVVLVLRENSTSKCTWGTVLLIVRALLRRPTVTCWSVHIHSVVAEKRDASTELLQRLHGFMKQPNGRLHWGRLQHECFIHSW